MSHKPDAMRALDSLTKVCNLNVECCGVLHEAQYVNPTQGIFLEERQPENMSSAEQSSETMHPNWHHSFCASASNRCDPCAGQGSLLAKTNCTEQKSGIEVIEHDSH